MGDAAHGFVSIGGDAPVSVQSMTAGYTYDIDKCVAEIHKLAAAGADLVRVAVPEKQDTQALKESLPQFVRFIGENWNRSNPTYHHGSPR